MKLRTKLTLWIAGLLLLTASALTAALFLIADRAAQATARSTLVSAVSRCAAEVESSRGRRRDYKARTYDDGAYLLIYSADGITLEAGTDVFGIQSMMPGLIQNNEEEQMFRVSTGEADVYCYILRLSGSPNGHRRGKADFGGRTGRGTPDSSGEAGIFGEPGGSGNADPFGDSGSSGNADSFGGTGSFAETVAGGSSDSVWIIGLLPEDSMANVTSSVVRLICTGLAVIVALAILGGSVIAGRSLRPLNKITESAREITDGHDLSRRISLAPGRDEVHELAETFNDMMGRLERSFDAERQFTSDASHELRTPVTVILAECEMAEKFPEDRAAVQESVAEIHKQALKMSELIGRLLAYTRLEQGTRRIDQEKVDLSELTGEVCEEQRAVSARDIAIECAAEPDILVNGDAALLISLVQNLVTNAVKYGKDGGHVWVRVYSEGQNACVSVRDDGIGIAEEDLDRIWNRFYQADRSRSDESRGIGLGLSLARQIARLHGGMITASSRPGEGSEFVFSMPKA